MGSGSVLEEIQSKIGGKWELHRSDNFEAALEAMGMALSVSLCLSLSLSGFMKFCNRTRYQLLNFTFSHVTFKTTGGVRFLPLFCTLSFN